ncbi:flocculation protein [Wolffia australiana]
MVYARDNSSSGEEADDPFPVVGSEGEGSDAGEGESTASDDDGDHHGGLSSASDDLERGVLQWLRALDLHVVGACRVDERLKPLFKLNVSCGMAEDRLVSQLVQHFEAAEIGTLSRCLCVPLVSIRVGKVDKRGTLLCPTTTKGYLQLALLPSSDMRLSFCGDDGVKESLAVVTHRAVESAQVSLSEISADGSGRTFLLSLPDFRLLYFWCSERSPFLGSKLLAKMKDLLRKRPSLSQLTGISERRLDSFATHLRAYLPRLPVPLETSSPPVVARPTSTRPANDFTRSLLRQDPSPQKSIAPSPTFSPPSPAISAAHAHLPVHFSPHYCWCPTPPFLPMPAASPDPLFLPPLPSLPDGGPRPLALPLTFPPLPSLSQQPSKNRLIPNFTPFMADPIVHIPVIDVCSSGQAYLVSAGPAISSAVVVTPLLPEADDSAAEKNARETLRLLIESAPSAPTATRLNRVLPVAGSRGLYAGTTDVGAAAAACAQPRPAPETADDEAAEAPSKYSLGS